jgi:threonine dehydrogenase-like Zn-dependent dehydrogenase
MRTIYVDKNIAKFLVVKALKPIWPQVVFSPLSPSQYAVLPEPELPGRRWIRVRNVQCGICASDLSLLFADADAGIAQEAVPSHSLYYLGHEVLGHVVEIGPDVSLLKVGDRVIMDSRFQSPTCLSQEIEPPCRFCSVGDYVRCENAAADIGPHGVGGGWGDSFTAHETEVYHVPDDLNDNQAMMIEPLSTGVRAVLTRSPQVGEKALVIGGGIVGLNVVQCLKALAPEARAAIMVRHPHQVEMARRLGADDVIVGEDGFEAVARLTGAHLYHGMFGNRMLLGGYDVVYDCVGTGESVENSLRWVRAGGSVVLIGVKLKRFTLDLNPIWYQEVDLVGVFAHGVESWQGQLRHTYDIVVDLIRQGKLVTEEFVTHHFPLDAWREAIAVARDKRTGSIKVVLDIGDGEG